ncbi:phosphotransferase family protein [Phenylobacterium sp.]|uniref:phosphotransferase family protein n=1 Tax=Phenylobacterium sp. TaxID=1871053 RepID=UPI002F428F7E
MTGVIVAPAVRDLSVLASQVAEWLRERIPGAQDLRVVDLTYPRGAGQSHETILFDAVWNEAGQARRRGLVVRIKPTKHTVYQDDMFEAQYRLMQVLHADGRVRVAQPLWFEDDPALLGAPFFVMEKLIGRVAVSVPPYAEQGWVAEASPAERARLWENGVRQLGAVQSVPLSSVGFLARPEAGPDGFDQEWDRWTRYLAWISQQQSWPFLEAVRDRLRERWPANRPSGLVWGDARIGNMLVDEDFRIIAVMDWEQPSLGGALHDLAWWLVLSDRMHSAAPGRPHLAGMGTREETIALWGEVTGVSTADIEWYEAFAAFKLVCLSVRMLRLKGRPIPAEGPGGPLSDMIVQKLDLAWPPP